jgi:hypothetical protein
MRMVVAAGGDVAGRIISIANSNKTVEEKIAAIYDLDPTRLSWTSQQWADLVGRKRQAVEKTHWWTVVKPELEKDVR